MKFFVSCAKGLEYLLVDELLALGCAQATATVAGVESPESPKLPNWSEMLAICDFARRQKRASKAGVSSSSAITKAARA